MRFVALVPALALVANLAAGQGTVQERDPRRPPPLEPTERCEVWEGTIAGNDPTAQASMQVCAGQGLEVTGVFLWSSLQSGWDRRAFVGAWSADGTTLTLRDTRMIESHPLNGWMLCMADRYDLRRSMRTRIEGTYESAGCSDHGRISLILRGAGFIPDHPATTDRGPAVEIPVPAREHHGRCACVVGVPATSGLALFGLVVIAFGLRRRRRARSRQLPCNSQGINPRASPRW